MTTHDVLNQPPPLEGANLFRGDRALVEGVQREAPAAPLDEIDELGERAGKPESIALGFEANEHPPELHTHDRFGRRIDEVSFHAAWHVLMATAARAGLHAAPWIDAVAFPHVRRAAKFYVWSQVEGGHGCPISMTYASIPALTANPDLARRLTPKLGARTYDPQLIPLAQKASAICGMGMTEKQGGSDVRANQTRALPATSARGNGAEYLLRGHKWFCSAPMSDAFLMLAQSDAGLSCFFVPRVLDDGTRNPFAIMRLKDKLGNRSNASAEIELDGTHGWMIGDDGRGVHTIVEMVNHTRLDCIIGSASLVRQALSQAIHHAKHRWTFGAPLIERALMQNVLADLALESEASTALFLRVARAIDEDSPLKRIGTAIGKYYVCKRAPMLAAEALECLGGNGYVEESIMPRLYREAPLNSIWEGSGNINALDVLRILDKDPDAVDAWRAEVAPAFDDPQIAAAARALESDLRDRTDADARARSLVERMALVWQAAILYQHAPAFVSDAFVRSRLAEPSGRTLGTLAPSTAMRDIVERAALY